MRFTRNVADVLGWLIHSEPQHRFGLAIADGLGLTANGTYLILDRLREAQMVERFAEPDYDPSEDHRPRRVMYRVTAQGVGFYAEGIAAREAKRQKRRERTPVRSRPSAVPITGPSI